MSVDPAEATRKHLANTGWTYTFLADPAVQVVGRYDLRHDLGDGWVISRPAEFLIDPSGTVRWVDLTDDFRVRTRPETVLEVFDHLQAGSR